MLVAIGSRHEARSHGQARWGLRSIDCVLRWKWTSSASSTVQIARNRSLHEFCLFKVGIALGELWYLSELAAWMRQHDRRYFLLTAPPLRLPGAVGSPVTPVATV